jgi:hypothetical protein
MTLTYTARLKLAVPDFLTEPWHSEFAQAMESIDRILYDAVLQQQADLWVNNHVYAIGDLIISPDNGSLYVCAVANTSTASPQTFTQELAAHPTFWSLFAPTLATQAEAEAGVENTKYMSALRTKQAITALTSQTALFTPRAGRLEYVSAAQLKFSPYNGNLIKIDGNLYEIPPAGIAGLSNTGVYVNGVSGQNLVADTNYFVYAMIVGGVVTANFGSSTPGHRPSQTAGNEGVEVAWNGVSEFNTNTLIGIIRTGTIADFADNEQVRYVRSWHNAPTVRLMSIFTVTASVSSVAYAEMGTGSNRIFWINFTGETINVAFSGPAFSPAPGLVQASFSIGLDSTTVAQDNFNYLDLPTPSVSAPMNLDLNMTPSEGNHFAALLASTLGGNAVSVWVPTNVAGKRPTIHALIPARG